MLRMLPYALSPTCRCGALVSQTKNPPGSAHSNKMIELQIICKSLPHMSLYSDFFQSVIYSLSLSFTHFSLCRVIGICSLCDFFVNWLSASFSYVWQLGVSNINLLVLIQISLLYADRWTSIVGAAVSFFLSAEESWVLWNLLVAGVGDFYAAWQHTGLSFCQKLDHNCWKINSWTKQFFCLKCLSRVLSEETIDFF